MGGKHGFTLLEVVLAMALIALLVGGIYGVARGAVQISSKVVRNQQRSMTVHSFLELCRRNFETMPGNAKIELISEGSVGQFLTELVITDYPLAFTWTGVPAGSAEVIMKTEKETSGSIRVVLQYLNEEEAEDRENALGSRDFGVKLTLLNEVKLLQWRFWDPRTEEWEVEWVDNARRPSLVELNLEFYDAEEPLRSVFWIPTMADPEQLTQAIPGGGAGAVPGVGGAGRGPQLPSDPAERRAALERLREQRQQGGARGGGGGRPGGAPSQRGGGGARRPGGAPQQQGGGRGR